MKKYFIDLFAGCGGLSLGLKKAGWTGLFAIEKNHDAFCTLKHNLIDRDMVGSFEWPEWLPCKEMTTSDIIIKYRKELAKLNGVVDLIAGGPPCQGFSMAGLRNPNDPRNKLTEEYIQIVEIVKPKCLLLENVKGFKLGFKRANIETPYAEIVAKKLDELGYNVHHQMLNASVFGVPQARPRFIMIAIRKDLSISYNPFDELHIFASEFLQANGITNSTTLKDSISDLEIGKHQLIECVDSKNFKQIHYKEPRKLSNYQKLMRLNNKKSDMPNSLRIPKHSQIIKDRFNLIINSFPKGKSLSKDIMESLGTKKRSLTPLHPHLPSRTITTLPDDYLHYSEPRILTVRENARIQSFPDWFEFMGKYTTGGHLRKQECPRYTQVGNAVPPLMSEGLGRLISLLIDNRI